MMKLAVILGSLLLLSEAVSKSPNMAWQNKTSIVTTQTQVWLLTRLLLSL